MSNEEITPEIDDVEAHGLKEVVMGAAAVAAIAGGAAAMAGSSSTGATGSPTVIPSVVVQVDHKVQGVEKGVKDATASLSHVIHNEVDPMNPGPITN